MKGSLLSRADIEMRRSNISASHTLNLLLCLCFLFLQGFFFLQGVVGVVLRTRVRCDLNVCPIALVTNQRRP
jgi:hypothetical protein